MQSPAGFGVDQEKLAEAADRAYRRLSRADTRAYGPKHDAMSAERPQRRSLDDPRRLSSKQVTVAARKRDLLALNPALYARPDENTQIFSVGRASVELRRICFHVRALKIGIDHYAFRAEIIGSTLISAGQDRATPAVDMAGGTRGRSREAKPPARGHAPRREDPAMFACALLACARYSRGQLLNR